MSLVCCECGIDVQPSDSFPGREGGMIHPNVSAVVWMADGEEREKWVRTYIEAPQNQCLCFQCTNGKLPEDNQGALEPVFEAYRAEINYMRLEKSQKGKWVSMNDTRNLDLFSVFEKKMEAVPQSVCLFCNTPLPGKQKAFFTFKVIDKTHCEQNLSLFSSYQWSDLETGMTFFKMCFGCVRAGFPRIFQQLSNDLRGTGESNLGEVVKSELYLSPEFLQWFFGVSPN